MKHQPLQIIVFRGDDVEIAPYEEALVRALQGGKDAGSYLATGDDLGIQLTVFSGPPKFSRRSPSLDFVTPWYWYSLIAR